MQTDWLIVIEITNAVRPMHHVSADISSFTRYVRNRMNSNKVGHEWKVCEKRYVLYNYVKGYDDFRSSIIRNPIIS